MHVWSVAARAGRTRRFVYSNLRAASIDCQSITAMSSICLSTICMHAKCELIGCCKSSSKRLNTHWYIQPPNISDFLRNGDTPKKRVWREYVILLFQIYIRTFWELFLSVTYLSFEGNIFIFFQKSIAFHFLKKKKRLLGLEICHWPLTHHICADYHAIFGHVSWYFSKSLIAFITDYHANN